MPLDALRLARQVKERLLAFALSDHFVRDAALQSALRELWARDDASGLVSELWVEGAFPAVSSAVTLQDLMRDGQFPSELGSHLDRVGAFPANRKLYSHQLEAFRAAKPKEGKTPAIGVSAGTGSGKTEAFLLPMLRQLWNEPRELQSGVRAIILYPMNALVNDQVDRLYRWLKDQSRLTLFHFTSETPEDYKQADLDGVPVWKNCRFRTRQEARGLETHDGRRVDPAEVGRGPQPDILITNYSMLEYMLSRPQDSAFFGPALRSVVLDEAHLYTGTLAAEITLLLRRLHLRCGVAPTDVTCYATSATLGGEEGQLKSFLSTVFSKAEDAVVVLRGEQSRAQFGDPIPPAGPVKAADIIDRFGVLSQAVQVDRTGETIQFLEINNGQTVRDALSTLVGNSASQKALARSRELPLALYDALRHAPVLIRLEEALWARRHIPVGELAKLIFPDEAPDAGVAATLELLRIGSMARLGPQEYPLLPHRLHLLVRAPDGVAACLNPSCPGRAKANRYGTLTTDISDRCQHCEHVLLELRRCDACGEVIAAGWMDRSTLRRPSGWQRSSQLALFTLEGDGRRRLVGFRTSDGEVRAASDDGCVPLRRVEEGCPRCDAERSSIRSFASGPALALPIVAETALAEVPPFRSHTRAWLPAEGRRLLVFSDSRAEAARLGPRLSRQHEIQLVRSLLARLLRDEDSSDESVRYYIDDLKRTEQQLAGELPQDVRRQKELDLDRLRVLISQAQAGGSVGDWVERFRRHPLVAQLLSPDVAGQHVARTYSQDRWEENAKAAAQRAHELIAGEVARLTASNDRNLQALGLAEVVYPGVEQLTLPSELAGRLPNSGLRDGLRLAWPELVASLLDTVRADGAITTGDDDLDAAFWSDRAPMGRWISLHQEFGASLVAFVGKTERHRRTQFVANVLSQIQPSLPNAADLAVKILQAAFAQLASTAPDRQDRAPGASFTWLEHGQRQTEGGPAAAAFRLRLPDLALRWPRQLYRCRATGTYWPRSVAGSAPFPGVSGTLEPTNHDQADADARIGTRRREHLSSYVFELALWAEEHSAQLSAKENRRLQDLFKAGIRNVLSSTTTLELGIDIGGLDAVLLSNVPPGKASYLQRAGRAGRRSDGSSIVMTFVRPRPFDRASFRSFGKYLDRELRAPTVLLDRERIALRHLGAHLLGSFFRQIHPVGAHVGAMDAFGRMGRFCGLRLPPRWDHGVSSPPPLPVQPRSLSAELTPAPWGSVRDEFGLEGYFLQYLFWLRDWADSETRESVDVLLRGTPIAGLADGGEWPRLIDREIAAFGASVAEWRQRYDVLFQAWASADNARQANAIRYQLMALFETTVIEALSDTQFLPRYGFPIGLLKLRVIRPDDERQSRVREEDQFRLERPGVMALREYVPGSEILVGGKQVTSRGILKHWTGADLDKALGIRGRASHCDVGHLFYSLGSKMPAGCPTCGATLGDGPYDLLFPTYGFTTAAWDSPKRRVEIELIGETMMDSIAFGRRGGGPDSGGSDVPDFGGVSGLSVKYQESGELLVYNRGRNRNGFAVCTRCGYADSERPAGGRGADQLPLGFEEHAPVSATSRRRDCWRGVGAQVMRHLWLAAREPTDLLLVDVNEVAPTASKDEATVTTVALALARAACELLDLDAREIGVLCVPTLGRPEGLGALLYDNVPGGAGHVLAAMQLGRTWLEEARRALYVDQDHHERCDSACLDCVLEFDVSVRTEEQLDRRLALEVMDAILGGGLPTDGPRHSHEVEDKADAPEKGPVRPPSDERLRRARARWRRA